MPEHKSLKSLKTSRVSTKKRKTKSTGYFWIIAVIFLLIAVTLLVTENSKMMDLVRGDKTTEELLTAEEAQKKLTDFINEAYGQSVKGIEVMETEEKSGVYAVTTLITNTNDQTSTSTLYISKDGKFFLPDAIDMEEILQKVAEQKQAQNTPPPAAADVPKADAPKVELFTMSYCPFGNQAEDGISPVARLLGDSVEIEPHYVIYSDYRGGGEKYCLDEEDKYCSMHGIEELNQNVRELCIYKYNRSKFWDYIDAVNKDCNIQNIEECWTNPADDLGIDTGKIATCQKDEAIGMLAEEVALNKKYGITGSPALVINGVKYSGGRAPENYKLGICNAFNTQPKECSETLGEAAAASTGGCN
ncbi:hypothetical protein HOD96_04315 [Candidatus Falkowbacteria bacterium]|nr:hypothetical protein [Candidatus Falkowbacteria bacterium]MBT4433472.1 hypothetical protein [Candidatus Falkowbacteria bacterium]